MGQFLEPNHCCNFRTITLYLTQIHNECIFQNVFPKHSLLVAFKIEPPFFKKNIILFILSSFPSFSLGGKKKIREAKWAASVHITRLAGDALRDLAEHCKYTQIHHCLA